MSKLRCLASGRRGHGINQVPNLLYGGRELLLQRLVGERMEDNCVISHGGKTTDPIKCADAGTHFHGDIISAGQGLSHGGQGSLLNVSDALIDVIDGVIALSLSRRFVPIVRNMDGQTNKKKKSHGIGSLFCGKW